MSTSDDNNKNGRKANGEICVLPDGRRVRFFLKRRPRDASYLACFRGPDDLRKERSTKEPNKRRATDAAVEIIKAEYALKLPEKPHPSWDEAIAMMKKYMEGDNLRPGTIQQYELVVGHLRRLYPDTHAPVTSRRGWPKNSRGCGSKRRSCRSRWRATLAT